MSLLIGLGLAEFCGELMKRQTEFNGVVNRIGDILVNRVSCFQDQESRLYMSDLHVETIIHPFISLLEY
jgi:hypothetical protein